MLFIWIVNTILLSRIQIYAKTSAKSTPDNRFSHPAFRENA